jgi:hypothetical protein
MGSRLPGIVLLALVVIAAALLIVGYGVAVGIGVLIGVALGLIAVVAFMTTMQRSTGWSFSVLDRAASPGVEPERDVLEQHGRDFMRVAGVVSGGLRRVIAIGRSVEAGGIRLELMALELREDGGLALLAAHSRPPTGQAGHFAMAHVRDDAGTEYVAAGQATGSSAADTMRHEVLFAPTPPAAARVLTLTIERFGDPFPGGGSPIEGPWSFQIDLRSQPAS